MARVCDDWIQTYLDWTLPRSESPETMILWSGLLAIASALKRKVKIPAKIMGGYDIYPNIYVIFVAPPGVARKSTTVGRAEVLLHEVDDIRMASTAVSASKLVSDLADTLDGSLTILPSELGTFMNVSNEEMYDLLTDLFDNKTAYTYSTRMHGLETVKEPCVNFLAATTPRWVEQQMPLHVIGGGFASRVIFIFEDAPRQRQLYYDIDEKQVKMMKEALSADLKHIAEITGTFRHESKKTRGLIEDWYQGLDVIAAAAGPGVEGYFNRKHIHVHKLMMLLSVAESDKLVLTKTHFEKALVILEAIEAKMPHALVYAGQNPLAEMTWKVWDYVKSGNVLTEKAIIRRFHVDLGSDGLSEVLGTLVRTGAIERIPNYNDSKKPAYRAIAGASL